MCKSSDQVEPRLGSLKELDGLSLGNTLTGKDLRDVQRVRDRYVEL